MLRGGLIKHDATALGHALRRWSRASLLLAVEARLVARTPTLALTPNPEPEPNPQARLARVAATRDAAAAEERAQP